MIRATNGRSFFIIAVAIVVLMCMAVPTFAMDDRVTASNVELHTKTITAAEAKNNSNWTKNYKKAYANGYVTAKQKHYANVKLYVVGQEVKKSGRKWGTGKVSVSTGWWKGGCAMSSDYYGRSIYYGFSK